MDPSQTSEIILARTNEEKEAIYKFRYGIFIQEQSKYYLKADHDNKMLYDEADEHAVIYYIQDNKDEIIATVRVIGGSESFFPSYAVDLFDLDAIDKHFKRSEYSISDRIMVHTSYRSQKIGLQLHRASFLKGLDWGTKLCFCSCEPEVLPLYLNYGWRCYADPITVSNGKKIIKLILILNDIEYLTKLNSPYLQCIPANYGAGKNYKNILKEKLDISLWALG